MAASRPSSDENLWFWGFLAAVACFFLALWALFHVLMPLFAALALAYAFGPLIDRLQRRGISRGWAVGGLMISLAVAFILLLVIIVPVLLDQAHSFVATFPSDLSTISQRAADVATRFGFDFPVGHELIESLQSSVNSLSFSSVYPGVDLARKVFSGLGHALGLIFTMATVPLFFFFLLKDLPHIKAQAFSLLPVRYQGLAAEELHKVDLVLSRYLRGQLTMSLILATVFSIALTLLDVKFGLFIGILTGFLNVVPYIGQATGLTLAVVMVSLDFKGWGNFWSVPATFACINFIESNFVSPRVVGGSVGLSTVQTILAVMIGAHLGGILGAALALPVAGTAKVLLLDLIVAYQASSYYKRSPKRSGKR